MAKLLAGARSCFGSQEQKLIEGARKDITQIKEVLRKLKYKNREIYI